MKKLIILLIGSVLTFNSCSNSFLDLSDPSTISPAVFPKTMDDMESLMTACYAQTISMQLYGKRVMAKYAFILDHTADLAWTGTSDWNEMALNNMTSSNIFIQTLWWGYYKVIQCANTVLEESEKIDKGLFSVDDLARLKEMKGEALFWRGWAHQQLVQFFGEGYPCNGDGDKLGVPIRLTVSTTTEAMNVARSSVNEVYEQIQKDYETAELLLPDMWTERKDYPRPTKYAVKSFIGQLNLFKGDYESAKAALQSVINGSGKELLPFDEYARMFNDNQVKFNKESILEINLKNGSSTGNGNWDGGEGSMHALLIALCYKDPKGNTIAAGWGNIFFHDSNITRFGSDPRLQVVALKPGDPVVMNGNSTVVAKYKDTGDDVKGWSIKKYNPLQHTVVELQRSVGINMYLMRLADVYLMYAEACQNLGEDVTAREYVNKVRRRAYKGDASFDIVSSGVQLRDDIREERFLELCAEGVQHWVDVCRWKTLDKEINKWYKKTAAGEPLYEPHDLYTPIPQKEIEDNSKMLQSHGY